ncbi:hypothetical protein DSO57_1017641 [Entomophthora muscae]|uniref:Uncharacterized protein n=1 Tax=Entomophthora muscae TaxID=34485 RepID=A0ACC2RVU7_9FUNG|nr:hypothetical protein DSO57_1017641 [Entomophthora muscae]
MTNRGREFIGEEFARLLHDWYQPTEGLAPAEVQVYGGDAFLVIGKVLEEFSLMQAKYKLLTNPSPLLENDNSSKPVPGYNPGHTMGTGDQEPQRGQLPCASLVLAQPPTLQLEELSPIVESNGPLFDPPTLFSSIKRVPYTSQQYPSLKRESHCTSQPGQHQRYQRGWKSSEKCLGKPPPPTLQNLYRDQDVDSITMIQVPSSNPLLFVTQTGNKLLIYPFCFCRYQGTTLFNAGVD